MNKKFAAFIILLLGTLACGALTPAAPAQPGVETVVVATFQALTAAAPTEAAGNGNIVSANNIYFVVPPEIGGGARAETVQAVASSDETPWWEIAPAHHKYHIEGYPLSGTFHTATVYVYPVNEYLQINADMAEPFNALKGIIAGQPIPENIPFLPAFPAAQMFHSNEKILEFQNGKGIRFLTQYGQAPYPINNESLFYTFQGMTNDGARYVAAILPIQAPFLPANGNPDTPLPTDGVPFDWENLENTQQHFNLVKDKLNAADPQIFTPPLESLDALIRSIKIE
ncbi:MAG: hypothetical protein LDL50_06070 [Chloroflexi bacterium]|nr:hypothetical protein [Chloroflexota bacterium]